MSKKIKLCHDLMANNSLIKTCFELINKNFLNMSSIKIM